MEDREITIAKLREEVAIAESNFAALARETHVSTVEHVESAEPSLSGDPVAEVAKTAVEVCQELEFLPSTVSSSDNVPQAFQQPERMKEHILALETGAYTRSPDAALGTSWKDYFKSFGCVYKGRISDTALNKWVDE